MAEEQEHATLSAVAAVATKVLDELWEAVGHWEEESFEVKVEHARGVIIELFSGCFSAGMLIVVVDQDLQLEWQSGDDGQSIEERVKDGVEHVLGMLRAVDATAWKKSE